MNWLIKQIFYFQYLILKQGKVYKEVPESGKFYPFISYSFTGGLWNEYLPWFAETKPRQDWNTYGIFNQLYGKFYFNARLDGLPVVNNLVGTYVPAIWLYDSRSENDVKEGRADHPYGYEIDIELFSKNFGYTIHWNHNGGSAGATVKRSLFANRKLYRSLQSQFHLFAIFWNNENIKFYIDGILAARFRNEIHTPMQIIMSKLTMTKTIIK